MSSPDIDAPQDDCHRPYQVINAAARIEGIMQDLHRAQGPVTLLARCQSELFPAHVKAVDLPRRQLLVTQLWNEAEHAALLADGHVNLSARHHGLPILFTVDVLGTAEVDGTPCYRMPFPAWLLCMEMRTTLRVRLPQDLQARLRCSLPLGLQAEATVFDISEGGIRFALPGHLAERLEGIATGLEAHLGTLQGEVGGLHMQLRRMERDGATIHIGATMEIDSEAGRQVLRRLIMAHQRRRLRLE